MIIIVILSAVVLIAVICGYGIIIDTVISSFSSSPPTEYTSVIQGSQVVIKKTGNLITAEWEGSKYVCDDRKTLEWYKAPNMRPCHARTCLFLNTELKRHIFVQKNKESIDASSE